MTTPEIGQPSARVEYLRSNNYGFRARGELAEELVVWGGVVANCGEDQLSRIVDSNSDRLRRVTYCPDRTKGGVLIRPKYYQGERGSSKTFPQLTDLAIRLEPALRPRDYGWITPDLRRLRLLCVLSATDRERDMRGHSVQDVRVPGRGALRAWLTCDPHGCSRTPLLQQVLADCPRLESVTVAFCSTAEEDLTETDWFVLQAPQPVPWSVIRLLLIPILKSAPGEGHALDESPLSTLSVGTVQLIVAFLGCPRWTRRDAEVPGALVARFPPLAAIQGVGYDDLLR